MKWVEYIETSIHSENGQTYEALKRRSSWLSRHDLLDITSPGVAVAWSRHKISSTVRCTPCHFGSHPFILLEPSPLVFFRPSPYSWFSLPSFHLPLYRRAQISSIQNVSASGRTACGTIYLGRQWLHIFYEVVPVTQLILFAYLFQKYLTFSFLIVSPRKM